MLESLTASWLATIANWAKRSSRRASLVPKSWSASASRTCPPKWTLNSVVSKSVGGPTPLGPSTSPFQKRSTVWPRPVTVPRPVMTTRRAMLLGVLLDVLDRLADRLDLLGLFVWDGDV